MNYEQVLCRVRAHPALWGDRGESKEAQASRILHRCKAKLEPLWQERADAIQRQRADRYMHLMT